VRTFRARLLYFLPKASVFFVQKRPGYAAARSRVPAKAYFLKGSDDGSLTTPRQGAWGGCGVVTCGRRPIGEYQQKNPRRISPRGLLTIFAMMALCQ
jgi:hypothetical protein